MYTDHRDLLKDIRTFPSLVKYLRDQLDWPIESDDFEELTFEYTPEELGIDSENAAKIQEIKRLRPLSANQPWGIFFVKFEPKRLPVVALRRILSRVVVKKRASANSAERAAWQADDLLFVSNYGEGEERRISFAHFAQDGQKNDLPTLKVLGWDNLDTALHLDHVAEELRTKLTWPVDENEVDSWRQTWRSAFTLRHREVITTSKALAVRLAELASDIRDRINTVLAIETEDGPLTRLMKAFQEALIHDLDEDGFADMYAQTIAYGLLSARITNPKGGTADDIAVQMPVTNPFLKELMETFLSVGGRRGKAKSGAGIDFDELGVSEVVELLDDANMAAVVRDFGDRNPQEDPVIHFYEDFLKEYDADQKVKRGVFYTPRPVVSFIVRSVDELLRTEFGLEDGLADTTTWGEMAGRLEGFEIPNGAKPEDPFVQILDPATGTGTFLVEVIDLIHKTITEKWKAEGHGSKKIEQLWNHYVPKHLLPRLYGYELLMAPYAIAHMKIGLKLYEVGYRFGADQRVQIFLANSLEPPHDSPEQLYMFPPALAHEAEVANKVKATVPFTVVMTNPPYSKVSWNIGIWAVNLVKTNELDGVKLPSFYEVEGTPLRERKLWLQDDYVKFIRLAQYYITKTNAGLFGYISNHGYLGNPTFNGMRQSLMSSFDSLRFVNLHGDSKVGEQPPPGISDANVFDIQQGVAVSFMLRQISNRERQVKYSDVWGTREEKYLTLSKTKVSDLPAETLHPASKLYLFVPSDQSLRDEFELWPLLPDVMPVSTSGIVTSRDGLVIGFSADEVRKRIETFLDVRFSDEQTLKRFGLKENYSWRISKARKDLRRNRNWLNQFAPIYYRPFDQRQILLDPAVVWRTRESVMRHMSLNGNLGLLATRQATKDFSHVTCSRHIIEMKACSHDRNTEFFPLWIIESNSLFTRPVGDKPLPNISDSFLEKVVSWTFDKAGSHSVQTLAENAFHYIMAILHSKIYRTRYADLLRRSYPRIAIAAARSLGNSLCQLGSEFVALHLMESPKLDDHITTLVGSGEFQVEKVSYSDETVWIDKAKTRGFRGVPEDVWNFHIGGYQVCEKWLKDRGPKKGNPGRGLTDEDIAHYQKIVVALNETIRLMQEIDETIEEHGGWPGAFQVEGKKDQ